MADRETIKSVGERIAVIEIQNSNMMNEIKQLNRRLEKVVDDHEHRLRRIERNGWRVQGIAATIGAVAGWLASKITGLM